MSQSVYVPPNNRSYLGQTSNWTTRTTYLNEATNEMPVWSNSTATLCLVPMLVGNCCGCCSCYWHGTTFARDYYSFWLFVGRFLSICLLYIYCILYCMSHTQHSHTHTHTTRVLKNKFTSEHPDVLLVVVAFFLLYFYVYISIWIYNNCNWGYIVDENDKKLTSLFKQQQQQNINK